MGKVISIVNNQFGSGKTFLITNLVIELSRSLQKVLVIDMDPQHELSQNFGARSTDDNMFMALTDKEKVEPVKIHPAIDLIPSSKDLMMCETEMVNCPNREFVLSEFIDKHWNNYDYIIIDNSSKAGLLMVNAIVASNLVIIPIADNCNTERTKKLSATITKTSKLLKDRKPKVRFMLNKKRDNTTGSATKKHIENACNGKFQNTELPKLKLYTQNTTEFWNPYKLSDNVCFKPLANEISNFKN